MDLPARVTVVEVGPRDGLRNEQGIVPPEPKIAFIEALVRRVVLRGLITSRP